jgi:hypothetical protein
MLATLLLIGLLAALLLLAGLLTAALLLAGLRIALLTRSLVGIVRVVHADLLKGSDAACP